jgi:hypothetical protein
MFFPFPLFWQGIKFKIKPRFSPGNIALRAVGPEDRTNRLLLPLSGSLFESKKKKKRKEIEFIFFFKKKREERREKGREGQERRGKGDLSPGKGLDILKGRSDLKTLQDLHGGLLQVQGVKVEICIKWDEEEFREISRNSSKQV